MTPEASPLPDDDPSRTPEGDVYDWYQRGLRLHSERNHAAAVQLLTLAVEAEPRARHLREALARAQFDAGWYADARGNFALNVAADPGDDYALFGLGLAESRLGDFESAVEHLALAAAMRPDLDHYASALRQARATLKFRTQYPPAQP